MDKPCTSPTITPVAGDVVSTFSRFSRRSVGNVGIPKGFLRTVERVGNGSIVFQAFHRSAFPRLAFVERISAGTPRNTPKAILALRAKQGN